MFLFRLFLLIGNGEKWGKKKEEKKRSENNSTKKKVGGFGVLTCARARFFIIGLFI
jgi:hypothetical protein